MTFKAPIFLFVFSLLVCGQVFASMNEDPSSPVFPSSKQLIQSSYQAGEGKEEMDYLTGTIHLSQKDISIPGNNGFDLEFIRYFDENLAYGSAMFNSTSSYIRSQPIGDNGWYANGHHFKTNILQLNGGGLCESGGNLFVPGEGFKEFLPAKVNNKFILQTSDNWIINDCSIHIHNNKEIIINAPNGRKYLFNNRHWKTYAEDANLTNTSQVSLLFNNFNNQSIAVNGKSEAYYGSYRLKLISDPYNNTLTYNYDSNDLLTSIVRNDGASLVFKYDDVVGRPFLTKLIFGTYELKYEYEACNGCVHSREDLGIPVYVSNKSLVSVKKPTGQTLWTFSNKKMEVYNDSVVSAESYYLDGYTTQYGQSVMFGYCDIPRNLAYFQEPGAAARVFYGWARKVCEKKTSGLGLADQKIQYSYSYMGYSNDIYLSVIDMDEVTIIEESFDKKISRVFNLDYKPRKWLTLSVSGNGITKNEVYLASTANKHRSLKEIKTYGKKDDNWIITRADVFSYVSQKYLDLERWSVIANGNANTAERLYGARINKESLISTLYDLSGNESKFSIKYSNYDEYGYPGKIVQNSGSLPTRNSVRAYEHDLDNHIIGLVKSEVVDSKASVITKYEKGQIIDQTKNGNRKTYSYDINGNMEFERDWVTSSDYREIGFSNYKFGSPQVITYADNTNQAYSYDDQAKLISVTDRKSNLTSHNYDADGRLKDTTPPTGGKIEYTYLNERDVEIVRYDGAGVAQIKNHILRNAAGQDSIEIAANVSRKPSCWIGAGAGCIAYWEQTYFKQKLYDEYGRLIYESFLSDVGDNDITHDINTARFSNGEYFTYDSLDRIISKKIISESGTSTSDFEYFSEGHTHSKFSNIKASSYGYTQKKYDGSYISTEFVDYEAGSYLNTSKHYKEISDTDHSLTLIDRNSLGMVENISRGTWKRQYIYDSNMRIKDILDPEVGKTSFLYNLADQVVKKSINDSIITEFEFDNNGRINLKTSSSPGSSDRSTTFLYDNNGNLISATESDENYRLARYDENNNIVYEASKINGLLMDVEYTRNSSDHITSVQYPDGKKYDMTVDSFGRHMSSEYFIDIKYSPAGALSNVLMKNGTSFNYEYLSYGVPKKISLLEKINQSYSFDNNSLMQISDLRDLSKSSSFDYDKSNRLTFASGPWGSINYNYDVMDNMISSNNNGNATFYDVDINNRLYKIRSNSTSNVTYDGNGRIISYLGKTISRNQEGRIEKVFNHNKNQASTVTYDVFGNRAFTSGSKNCYHFYTSKDRVLLYEQCEEESKKFIYANGNLILRLTNTNNPQHKPILGTISAPSNVTTSDSVTISTTATDREDGNISSHIQWSSSIDGVLSKGSSFNSGLLSKGSHTITAFVKDSSGWEVESKKSIVVADPITAPEEEVDCEAACH